MSRVAPGARILVVDDEDNVLITIKAILEMDGHIVDVVQTAAEALEMVNATDYDVVLTDLRLGDDSGQDVLAGIRKRRPTTITLMLTGYASLESAVSALRQGAYDYLIKPSDPEELRATVRRAVERRQLGRALEQRVRELEDANQRIADLNTDLEKRVEDATSELRHAVERLQELDHLKSQFLSIASHELRTPITAVSGFAQLALRDLQHRATTSPDGYAQELARLTRQLTIIHDQSAKLGRLVRELLDVSRIQAGRLEFHLTPTDVSDVVRTVAEQMQMVTTGRRIEVDANGPITILGDRDHLEQVVGNLVDNAIKYSAEDGPIQVRVRREDQQVHVTVEDKGIGIPADQVARVFDIFYRTSEAERRRTPGLGLGLFITRGIVERHGGRIWAESEVGRGTKVHVVLPLENVGPPVAPERPTAGAATA
jgi:signal transduction histidine kinase